MPSLRIIDRVAVKNRQTLPSHVASDCSDGVQPGNHLPKNGVLPKAIRQKVVRGRGAISNRSSRFERECVEPYDDGWQSLADLPPLKTEVHREKARSVLTGNDSPDIPFERSLNPYRGCEHGCIYCYARPSHSFLGHSAGLDFEQQLYAKDNAAEILEHELGKPKYQPKPIMLGSNTDPYQPIEKEHKITRSILEVLWKYKHPAFILSRSRNILRDSDILTDMAAAGLVKVGVSITSLENKTARTLEPRAPTPARRLEIISKLTDCGIPCSVFVAPVIPAITDHEIERIIGASVEAGASGARYILLRLPREVSGVFKEWLLEEYPGKYRHVISLLRSMRGGKDYDSDWGKRFVGEGPYALQIAKRFQLACKKHGLQGRSKQLDCTQFIRPTKGGVQLSLF
ncbi:PA0069 family radical SAM protein [Polycladidibacter stylochi]|uniref:PA0069 family radical SAM protein n=1 Tax=Polycladidibacter stylochi TaxID=1807766 RepID=UPI0009E794C7|nr:PA0069 family radical SAM protein [Pseudovibrio stylochi]